MKKIIGIMLICFLGFLGCSGSDDGTTTVGKANPVAPYGIVETPTPPYEWTPVPGATKYRLVVQDTNEISTNANTNEAAIIDEWYTAEEADCTSEENLCKVTPEIEAIGQNAFKILACANEECGSWSEQLNFDFTPMDAPRFTDNGDGTVTDRATQSTWTKNSTINYPISNWRTAIKTCDDMIYADASDWYLPNVYEIKRVLEAWLKNPELFRVFSGSNTQYWTNTIYHEKKRREVTAVYVADITQGLRDLQVSLTPWRIDREGEAAWCVEGICRPAENSAWCVRGGYKPCELKFDKSRHP